MDILISYPFSIPIPVRRYGLSDVSDEFLVLLSHATQERMKGVVEKLTQISQHRLNVLKVITNTTHLASYPGQSHVFNICV